MELYSITDKEYKKMPISPFTPENILNLGKNVINAETKALVWLEENLDSTFTAAVEMILACQGRIIFCSIGKPGYIGRKLAASFSSTGTPSFFVHPAEAAHGDLGMITKEDLVILLSHSGKSDEIVRIIPIIKLIGAKLIAITSQVNSPISKLSELTLLTGVLKEADPNGQAPTTSTIAILSLGDALVVTVSQMKGLTPEGFRFYHPGGALGKPSISADKLP